MYKEPLNPPTEFQTSEVERLIDLDETGTKQPQNYSEPMVTQPVEQVAADFISADYFPADYAPGDDAPTGYAPTAFEPAGYVPAVTSEHLDLVQLAAAEAEAGHAVPAGVGPTDPGARSSFFGSGTAQSGPVRPQANGQLGKRSWAQRLLLSINISVIMLTLLTVVTLSYSHIRASSINRIGLDNQLASTIGEPGSRVLNILLVGSDSAANLDPDDPVRIRRQNQRLGDVIIIAHLDERTGEVALLSLPRDLWLPIGGSTSAGRINSTFALGGPAQLIQTIEENFAIPIHHYVNVDFAGFKGLVEAVGSVDVYFDTPARDWNVGANPPRSQTGFEVKQAGCVSLGPDQALAYVRSRYYQTQDEDGDWQTDPSSDLGRIQRQQDFLAQLMARSIEKGARNPIVLSDLVDAGLENVTIDQDLTPQTLLDLGRTFGNFEPEQLNTYSLPVAGVRTSSGEVLIPIESKLDPVARLFAGNRFDEPTTIGVSLVAEAKAYEAQASRLFLELESQGYEMTENSRDDFSSEANGSNGADSDGADGSGLSPNTQIVIEHSASDFGTAKTVLASLDADARAATVLVEDDGLPARIVLVSVTSKIDAPPNADLAFKDQQAEGGDVNESSEDEANGQATKQPTAAASCG